MCIYVCVCVYIYIYRLSTCSRWLVCSSCYYVVEKMQCEFQALNANPKPNNTVTRL